jgi:transcriptional regulator with XRE-family HTH domain
MYEQGRREPSVETLVELSQLFGVSLDYLITGIPTEQERGGLEAMLRERIDATQTRLSRRPEAPFSRQELALLFAAMLLD